MYAVAPLPAKPNRAHAPTILVVDDEPEIRAVVADFLEDFGFRVVLANSGAEALAQLRCNSPVELLLTDIRMPEMSGIELANLATERHPHLKVILMSGYFVSQQMSHRFLFKPFRMQELYLAVQAELGIIS